MYVLIKCHLNISRAILVHSLTMPPFPWDAFKAETLRLMCKDLGAGASVKRTRGDMISFLKVLKREDVRAPASLLNLSPIDRPSISSGRRVGG